VNPALRVGGFVAGLTAAFGLAFAVGSSASPLRPEQKQHAEAGDSMGMGEEEHAAAEGRLPGLAVSDAGYTLSPLATRLPAGQKVPYRFRITDDAGRPVGSYELEHDKELHLIVVRRDLTGFQHVHPVRAGDGTWSVPLDLARAGSYRVFADFHPAGLDRKLTLGADLFVGGRFAPVALPAPAPMSSTDGYVVRISGTARAGKESELTFDVTRDGKQVTDLEPYLGAFGHLVSLRTGDLAYLHTHPGQEAHAGERGGPQVHFMTTFPTAGTYRLFLDFKHGGAVHTASFTMVVAR
jgi:hypothetical protein